MREREVPQEGNPSLAGQRKAVYALADDGKLRVVPSRGWEVEEIVTRQAVEELERRAEEARARALAGQASPLEYHMYRARMDLALLAQSSGLWRWRVRRHFKPRAYARLPLALKTRYAEALGIPIEALDRVE
jgi:DNA-binding GntR family transcriptional regulator